jgi:hypothetical protein
MRSDVSGPTGLLAGFSAPVVALPISITSSNHASLHRSFAPAANFAYSYAFATTTNQAAYAANWQAWTTTYAASGQAEQVERS